MSGKGTGRRPPGRPSLPGKPKFLRIRESVFQLWRERKKQLGFEKVTDSAFAEVLLHRCPADIEIDARTLELEEERETLPDFHDDEPEAMSTPIRAGQAHPSQQQEDSDECNSLVDVTGVSKLGDDTLVHAPTRSWLLQESIPDNPYSMVDGKGDDASNSENSSDGSISGAPDYNFDDIHPDLQKTMQILLDELNRSDREDSSSDSDEGDGNDELYQHSTEMSMDTSIEDDERTLTMVDPLYGEESTEPAVPVEKHQAGEDLGQSKRVEDNKEKILESFQHAFADLTSVDDLPSFLALHSRLRVMVSVDKLLELNGMRCMSMDGEQICGRPLVHHLNSCGSRVELTWKCDHGHFKKWESSEILAVKHNNATYVNDSLQAAAIIISGNNYSKFSLLAKALNLNLISSNTFLRFQKHCAEPVIKDIWSNMNNLINDILKEYDDMCLCGDGRNDSPGHCARYCVYTLMEHASKVVVDFEVLDNRETGGNSVTMEREGLRRLLERLADTLPFSELATDASSTIMKLVRETKEKFPQLMEFFHSLDIWHKAKKLSKCLHQAARLKGCEAIKPWIDDIVNHFWYCCQSCEGNVEELKNAWFGVLHHVCGEHSWAEGECKHSPESVQNQDKAYLAKSSKPMAALRNVILDKKWLNHFSFYVRFRHTSDLESYNSMLTKYAPKRMAFEYPYFIMRIMLAAIDHNMHLFRGTKKKGDGSECGHRKYSKRTQRYHAEPVKEDKNYSYFPFLMSRMLKERCVFQGSFTQRTDDNLFNPKQIAPTLGMKEPPPTQELMKGPSRFVKPQ